MQSRRLLEQMEQKGKMTAKEYLQQARTLDLLINAKQDELYALRLTATSVSSPVLGDKVEIMALDNFYLTSWYYRGYNS